MANLEKRNMLQCTGTQKLFKYISHSNIVANTANCNNVKIT